MLLVAGLGEIALIVITSYITWKIAAWYFRKKYSK